LAVVLLLGTGYAVSKTLISRYESSVSRDTLLDPGARDDAAAGSRYSGFRQLAGPLNYLLIGSDLRAANPGAGQRSDSIVIVQVNRTLDGAHLISIPRDLMVRIPAADDGTDFTGSEEKINAAFEHGGGGSGGVRLLSATLTQLTGLRFDGAAVIDFGGFEQAIDALGGVTLCVDQPVRSIHTDRMFLAGCQQMDGSAALDFSRQRYGLTDGDYDRQKHQQQLLKAIFSKAMEGGVTRNPIKLDQFIRSIGGSLTVDTGAIGVTDLLFSLRDIRPGSLRGVRVPSAPETVGDTSYVLLAPEADGLFAALREGDLAGWTALHPEWVNAI
jgi:LCP family protein required for cell wall assembly